MPKRSTLPIALTIAGSDSGGGAGIQADLKTFAALGVHGTSAITSITAQNPRRVIGAQAAGPDLVRRQLEAMFEELPPDAAKTGMLPSAAIVRVVADFFARRNRPPFVVDPVMVSTSGARLISPGAVRSICDQLLPRAALVTPNLDEASLLVGRRLVSIDDMRFAAHEIHRRFGCAALVKGGHLKNVREAADIFYDGHTELLLTAPFIKHLRTHGTGCTYSAAITGFLALGQKLPAAVSQAKEFITKAIARSQRAAGHPVLNPLSAGKNN